MKKVAVIGGGYVGLTTAVCLSSIGHHVKLVENDPPKLKQIQLGRPHFFEPGLAEILRNELQSGSLEVCAELSFGIRNADFVFICLPTPQSPDGSADTSIIEHVMIHIRSNLKKSAIVVTKSTMPIGSSKLIGQLLNRDDVRVVVNPEFLREGTALRDAMNPNRIVVGSLDEDAAKEVASLFEPLKSRVVITDPQTAEIAKYASNAFLAMKVSYANSLATLCTLADGNIREVTEILGLDPRIGPQFLRPGPGWGGSCFPKDTASLLHQSQELDFDFRLIEATIQSNLDHQKMIVASVIQMLSGIKNSRVCALGVTFKAGTDDIRDSPALAIIDGIRSHGIDVVAYDPLVPPGSSSWTRPDVTIYKSIDEAFSDADLLLVLTEWDEFRLISPSRAIALMRSHKVFDCRDILNHKEWAKEGFEIAKLGHRLSQY